MLRLLSDENFNGDIVRGLMRHVAQLDCIRVQDVGLMATPDEMILEWAANEGRILLSHDISTVPPVAHHRVAAGQPMPGVIVVPEQLSIGQAIEDIVFLATEIDAAELANQVLYLPL